MNESTWLICLQVDEEPAIRTNTTILLGNIASYLNEAVGSELILFSYDQLHCLNISDCLFSKFFL